MWDIKSKGQQFRETNCDLEMHPREHPHRQPTRLTKIERATISKVRSWNSWSLCSALPENPRLGRSQWLIVEREVLVKSARFFSLFEPRSRFKQHVQRNHHLEIAKHSRKIPPCPPFASLDSVSSAAVGQTSRGIKSTARHATQTSRTSEVGQWGNQNLLLVSPLSAILPCPPSLDHN
jgi:hypothetical protein